MAKLAIGIALTYLGLVLLAPLSMLLAPLWSADLAALGRALLTPDALHAIRNSLALAALAVLINGVFGVLGGLVLARQRFWGRGFCRALADLPLAISPVMAGLAFFLLFGRDGYFAAPLAALNLELGFSFAGMALATLFVTLPYTVSEVTHLLAELGDHEEQAAATLGASPLYIFWRITLPKIRSGLGAGSLMTLARSLGEFGAVLIVGGSITGETQTATTFIHDALEERADSTAYALAMILALTSMVALFLLEQTRRGREENERGSTR